MTIYKDTLGEVVEDLYLASNASIRIVIVAIIAIICVNCAEIAVISNKAFDCSVTSG